MEITSLVLLPLAIACFTALVFDVPIHSAPETGPRGLARKRARQSAVFRMLEPLLKVASAHIARLPLSRRRVQLDRVISAAGELHGLDPDEVIALSLVSGVVGVGIGYFFWSAHGGVAIPLACCVLGPLLPSMQLRSLAKDRRKAVDRDLPAAIDLASLCMGAGLDFPGAISHVVENMSDGESPVRQELRRIQQELALGHTREQALLSFASRVETNAVNEFVSAVVQAERKGTALSTVLSVQATALRERRSVLAEESAARAGVLLMLPMLMMMVSIALILMGPLLIDMMNGGLI